MGSARHLRKLFGYLRVMFSCHGPAYMRREAPGQPRKAIRFPLEAPMVFRWADSGTEKQGEGRTHDISEVGAFVLSSICPPVGTEISFNIFLPALPGFEPQTRVEAVGRVVPWSKPVGSRDVIVLRFCPGTRFRASTTTPMDRRPSRG